jgi:hypothetical protein
VWLSGSLARAASAAIGAWASVVAFCRQLRHSFPVLLQLLTSVRDRVLRRRTAFLSCLLSRGWPLLSPTFFKTFRAKWRFRLKTKTISNLSLLGTCVGYGWGFTFF